MIFYRKQVILRPVGDIRLYFTSLCHYGTTVAVYQVVEEALEIV
jgi:hypothetical protein